MLRPPTAWAWTARSPFRLLVASLLLGPGRGLNLLDWNPHWQCFTKDNDACAKHASLFLSALLQDHDMDFANIVEFEYEHYEAPEPWVIMRQKCGLDISMLIYHSGRWRPAGEQAAGASGCMKTPDDRSFIVQQFEQTGGDQKLVVAGAHYPHSGDKDRTALKDGLASVRAATGVEQVILMADTNEDASTSNEVIMQDIGVSTDAVTGTKLENTCCFDIGYVRPFDRIIANFEANLSTLVLLEPWFPEWAKTGQLHKPMVAKTPWPDKEETGLALTNQKFDVSVDVVEPHQKRGSLRGARAVATVAGVALVAALALYRMRRVNEVRHVVTPGEEADSASTDLVE
mmetsp:Transcript_70759/g.199825  ORF Transcript_70759/g.199825 Transcript_70759/m.199825 type:complete len:344 (-) Transcript_70759:142-1173(-)